MGKPKMRVSYLLKVVLGLFLVGTAAATIAWYVQDKNVAVLSPAGTIAAEQRNLLFFATILSLIVVIPVFVLTFFIVWKYRASNTKAVYDPEWDHSRKLEAIWWGIPCAIILVLAGVTWVTSHTLDPFRPINSDKTPLKVQVVALEWKWLFIYPEQSIATVNYVQFPKDRPIDFEITSDAPMNSFWIPQLGGQIYAMSGMSTQLHLMATKSGTFEGMSANLSGAGFSGMRFKAVASTDEEFNDWVSKVRRASGELNAATYAELAKPSENNPRAYYAKSESGLYDTVVMKYMAPATTHAKPDENHTNHDAKTHR